MSFSNESIQKYPYLRSVSRVVTNPFFLVISFAVLTALSAQIAVNINPVPFTFQTAVVVLAGAFLGARNGFFSQLSYLAMGLAGMPVFAGGSFGPAVLFGPTGGYLLAFPLAAFLTGFIVEKNKSYFAVTSAMFFGNVAILALGALFLGLFFPFGAAEAFRSGILIFLLWTVVKVFIASSIYFGISRFTK